MKYCWHCGRENQSEARYCRHCGAQFAQLPAVSAEAPLPQTSGMAIASLVLGIVWIYWIGLILALIFGYLAKGEIDRDPQRVEGRGMAIAGIVLGWVGVATLVLALVALFAWLATQGPEQSASSTTHTTAVIHVDAPGQFLISIF